MQLNEGSDTGDDLDDPGVLLIISILIGTRQEGQRLGGSCDDGSRGQSDAIA